MDIKFHIKIERKISKLRKNTELINFKLNESEAKPLLAIIKMLVDYSEIVKKNK